MDGPKGKPELDIRYETAAPVSIDIVAPLVDRRGKQSVKKPIDISGSDGADDVEETADAEQDLGSDLDHPEINDTLQRVNDKRALNAFIGQTGEGINEDALDRIYAALSALGKIYIARLTPGVRTRIRLPEKMSIYALLPQDKQILMIAVTPGLNVMLLSKRLAPDDAMRLMVSHIAIEYERIIEKEGYTMQFLGLLNYLKLALFPLR